MIQYILTISLLQFDNWLLRKFIIHRSLFFGFSISIFHPWEYLKFLQFYGIMIKIQTRIIAFCVQEIWNRCCVAHMGIATYDDSSLSNVFCVPNTICKYVKILLFWHVIFQACRAQEENILPNIDRYGWNRWCCKRSSKNQRLLEG